MAKATFCLVNGTFVLSKDQAPLTGDAFYDDEPSGSVRYPSDLALIKPAGECMLVGHFESARGPVTAATLGLRVGALHKELVLFGDRHFRGGLFGGISEPAPFVTMPLVWERAFGGPDIADNPVGRGVSSLDADGRLSLPNIEDRGRLITSKRDRPTPAGAFPLHPAWRARMTHFGTYDAQWARTRFPAFPADLGLHAFCSAPAELRLPRYFEGDERVVLDGVVRDSPRVSTTLPDLRARAFLRPQGSERLREIPLHLDTLVIEAPTGRLTLIFRGIVELDTPELRGATQLFVTHEPRTARAPVEAHEARLLRALLLAEAEARDFEAVTPEGAAETPATPAEDPAAGRAEALAAIAAGRTLAGAMLAGADLRDLDLQDQDLEGAVLRGADLRGAKLARARLDDAVLIDANLSALHLEGSSLRRADLSGADLSGVRLDGVALDGAVAIDAILAGAELRRCTAVGAELSGAQLTDARFEACLLDGADLSRARLDGATLSGCSLVDASLELGASAAGASFPGSDLSKLRAGDGSRFDGADFRGAKLDGARFGGASLRGAQLSLTHLARADFSDADLEGALLLGVSARGARFDRARLGGASFVRADLMEARFEDALLTGADLRGANLHGAELFGADTQGARLELALLTGTKLA